MDSMEQTLASVGSMWKRLFTSNVLAAAAIYETGGLAERLITNPFVPAANLAVIDIAPAPTLERPDYASGNPTPLSIMFRLFGTDANVETFGARIWGIDRSTTLIGGVLTPVWSPTLLAEITATLGIAGIGSFLWATGYAQTSGATSDTVISSLTSMRGAYFRVDNLAHSLVAVEFGTPLTAAECNGVYRFLW